MSKPAGSSNIVDQKDIKKSIVLVLKNWYWFVLFLGLGIGGSVLYLYKATKYYGATAKVLVKPQNNAFKDALSASLASGPSKDEIANEVEVLYSSSILNEVISKLNLDISYFIEGRLKTGEIYKGRPFIIEGKVIDTDYYGAPFNVNVINQNTYRLSVSVNGQNYSEIHKFGEAVVNDRFSLIAIPDTGIIRKNSTNLSETKYIFKINDRNYLISKYQTALKISQEEQATVIKIFIEDEVPEKAVSFLKTLTEQYIAYSVSTQKQINENTLAFIEG